MMNTSINLLPPELLPRGQRRRYERQQRRSLSKGHLMFIIAGSMLIGFYLIFLGSFYLQSRQVVFLARELATLEVHYRQAAVYEGEIKMWQEKTAELKRLEQGIRRWGTIISAINKAMPPEMELVRLEEDIAQGKLVIEGNSPSLQSMSIFLNNLQQSSYWQAINFQEVEANDTGLTFIIQVIFAGDNYAAATGKGKTK